MAKMARTKVILQEAVGVKAVWEKNPDFTLGTIGFAEFLTVLNATVELDQAHATRDVELSGMRDNRDDKARELRGLITRFRSGMRAHYGPDSAEYSQSGGTRLSARKPPSRKAKAASATNGAAEHAA